MPLQAMHTAGALQHQECGALAAGWIVSKDHGRIHVGSDPDGTRAETDAAGVARWTGEARQHVAGVVDKIAAVITLIAQPQAFGDGFEAIHLEARPGEYHARLRDSQVSGCHTPPCYRRALRFAPAGVSRREMVGRRDVRAWGRRAAKRVRQAGRAS